MKISAHQLIFIIWLTGQGLGSQSGCAQHKNTQKDSSGNKNEIYLKQAVDVLKEKGWVWEIRPKVYSLPPSDTVPLDKRASLITANDEAKKSTAPGYRVQLFSTTDYYAALRARNEALIRFDREIYFDFESPYYKIRMGDFINRQEAEAVKDQARQFGYHEAWVVQTIVFVTKP